MTKKSNKSETVKEATVPGEVAKPVKAPAPVDNTVLERNKHQLADFWDDEAEDMPQENTKPEEKEPKVKRTKAKAAPVEEAEEEKQEIKEDKPDSEETKITRQEKESSEPDVNFDKLKKMYDDTRKWGHDKNQQLLAFKKNATQIFNELLEKDVIYPEEKEELLNKLLTKIDVEEEAPAPVKEESPIDTVVKQLNDEFAMYKKYTREKDADNKYNAFFALYNVRHPDTREKIKEYMLEEKDVNKLLDFVMYEGEKLHNTLAAGIEKHGDIVEYVQALQKKINKIEEDNKKLKSELDTTVDHVYNKPTKPKMFHSSNQSSPKVEAFDKFWND